jgi:hypothetical protein
MPQTLLSAGLLCPPAEFLKRIDPFVIGKLASDDPNGIPIPPVSLPTNPNVIAALLDASGEVESAIAKGERYQADDIQAILTANPQTAATGKLFRMVSDLAWVFLFERRPNKDIPEPPSLKRTLAMLDELAQGKRIFYFQETADAGLGPVEFEASPADVMQRNGAVQQARPFYGQTSDDVWTWPRPGG